MTDREQLNLLRLDGNIRKLMGLVRAQQDEIESLRKTILCQENQLKEFDELLKIAETKNRTLLTAKALSAEDKEVKDAKARLAKLIRDVDKCIALLETE